MKYKVIFDDGSTNYEKIFENKEQVFEFLKCGHGTFKNIMLNRVKGLRSDSIFYSFFKIETVKLTEEEKRLKLLSSMKKYMENMPVEKKEEISKMKKEKYKQKKQLKNEELIIENKKKIIDMFQQ